MGRKTNRKGVSGTAWAIAAIIIVIVTLAIVTYAFSDTFKGLWRDVEASVPSEKSISTQKCEQACSNAKSLAKDCDLSWKAHYCDVQYSDTMTCGEAELAKNALISKCVHEINKLPCSCS